MQISSCAALGRGCKSMLLVEFPVWLMLPLGGIYCGFASQVFVNDSP